MYDADWLARVMLAPAESEHVEFKEAKQQFGAGEVRKYCVALANEGGGFLILGISRDTPRRVVGTAAFSGRDALNELKLKLLRWNRHRVEIHEIITADGRVLAMQIPSRPLGSPLEVDGSYLMRSGESLVGMTPDRLKTILVGIRPGLHAPARCGWALSRRGRVPAGHPEAVRLARSPLPLAQRRRARSSEV